MKKRRSHAHRSSRPESRSARSPIVPGREPASPETDPGSLDAHWRAWLDNKGPVLRFGLKFGALMGVYYVLVLTPLCDRLLYGYLAANASLANGVLNWLGQETLVSEITIRSARFAITIRRGCDAVEPSWFLCAALLSFPAPWSRKVVGIAAGIVLLQALNLGRIVSLYLIGRYYPALFRAAHLEIWPVIFVVVALFLWLAWISWTKQPAPNPPHVAA